MDFLHSLFAVSAEDLLSTSVLVLLLVAAWGGDKASRAISIVAFAVLVGAAALAVPALTAGAGGAATSAFGGHIKLDAFAAFANHNREFRFVIDAGGYSSGDNDVSIGSGYRLRWLREEDCMAWNIFSRFSAAIKSAVGKFFSVLMIIFTDAENIATRSRYWSE